MASLPDYFYTTPNSFTKKVYRDVYPAVDIKQPSLSQAGKTVMITGASRGIGKDGMAYAFAAAGAKGIVITARTLDSLKSTEELIKQTNPATEVLPLALEISDPASVSAAFAAVKQKFSVIDILVNNAGMLGEGLLAGPDTAAWWKVFEVNVRGTQLVTSAFLRQLPANHPAHVTFLTSGIAMLDAPGLSAYSITKMADLRLAAYVAAENPNVVATAFHPGIVLTAMPNDYFKLFAKDTPQLAGSLVVWLSSERGRFMNGRYMTANWDVEEMEARKEEIVKENKLTVRLNADLITAELA